MECPQCNGKLREIEVRVDKQSSLSRKCFVCDYSELDGVIFT